MIVYSAHYHLQLCYIVILVLYLIDVGVGIHTYKYLLNNEDYKLKKKVVKYIVITVFSVFAFFISLFAIFYIGSDLRTYNDTYKKYKSGEYEEVEGYVRNFKVKQDEDKRTSDEEFYINGEYFKVYAGEPWPYWYSPVSIGGGIINHDGQYVRVKYETHKFLNGKERKYIMEIYLPVIEE